MEGQDQKSPGKQNCEASMTFYMIIVGDGVDLRSVNPLNPEPFIVVAS